VTARRAALCVAAAAPLDPLRADFAAARDQLDSLP
jgi:hypothetical protein